MKRWVWWYGYIYIWWIGGMLHILWSCRSSCRRLNDRLYRMKLNFFSSYKQRYKLKCSARKFNSRHLININIIITITTRHIFTVINLKFERLKYLLIYRISSSCVWRTVENYFKNSFLEVLIWKEKRKELKFPYISITSVKWFIINHISYIIYH